MCYRGRGGRGHGLALSVGGVTCYWIKKWWRRIAYWCIQTKWSIIGVYFSIVCDFRPWRASQNQSHFAPFAFTFPGSYNLSFFSCLVFCTGKQACWKHLTWFFWVRIGRFCIEDFDLVAIWCICKCSLFVYCKGYQSILWQCLSYLIYIDKQP